MKIDNSEISNSKISVIEWKINEIEKPHKKTTYLNFTACNFFSDFFLIPSGMVLKISEKNITEYFTIGVLVFPHGKIFVVQSSSTHKK